MQLTTSQAAALIEHDAFSTALRDMQVRQWEMSEHARRWSHGSAEDLRRFAADVKAVNKAFDALLRAGAALTGAQSDFDDCPDAYGEFAWAVKKEAEELESDARDLAAEGRPMSYRAEDGRRD